MQVIASFRQGWCLSVFFHRLLDNAPLSVAAIAASKAPVHFNGKSYKLPDIDVAHELHEAVKLELYSLAQTAKQNSPTCWPKWAYRTRLQPPTCLKSFASSLPGNCLNSRLRAWRLEPTGILIATCPAWSRKGCDRKWTAPRPC